ncbi:MAG TPA: mandelate racemase/muconate lactonizing enzyme family protein [Xanthobacteraceae bacterium]|jgi:L-alanine-DL-glutamate epimerase-like enolase superfamily enzyme|nr:mandelate racemase/muconate lactonizing enzyme family protein [Xanthobacteraceae bacterium]
MKIQQVKTNVVRMPPEEPLVGAPVAASMMREYVTVQILTDDGVEGIGVTGFGGKIMKALKAAVDDFGDLIKGDDPLRHEAIAAKLRAAAAPCGPQGIATLALAAIDIALWDIRGKAFGVPVARLLGGLRDKVPAYASGALMRTSPLKDVERAAAALVEKGYTQMKTQMAVDGLTPAQEIERIHVVRNAIGPDIALMCDINQRWSVAEAISIASRIEDVGLTWLEDPTTATDHHGLAEIASALTMPVCAGEYLYGVEPHAKSLVHHSVDIVMIDVLRAGGITGWMKIAAMAEGFSRPVVSHLLPEIQVHTIAAAPNGLTVEYMPWTWRLFENPPMPQQGEITVPAAPGLGLKFAPELFRKYGLG